MKTHSHAKTQMMRESFSQEETPYMKASSFRFLWHTHVHAKHPMAKTWKKRRKKQCKDTNEQHIRRVPTLPLCLFFSLFVKASRFLLSSCRLSAHWERLNENPFNHCGGVPRLWVIGEPTLNEMGSLYFQMWGVVEMTSFLGYGNGRVRLWQGAVMGDRSWWEVSVLVRVLRVFGN